MYDKGMAATTAGRTATAHPSCRNIISHCAVNTFNWLPSFLVPIHSSMLPGLDTNVRASLTKKLAQASGATILLDLCSCGPQESP